MPLYSSGARSDAVADVLLPSARHDVRSPSPHGLLHALRPLFSITVTTLHVHSIQIVVLIVFGMHCGTQVNRWVLAGVALFVFADD